jgi:hypothetical protein
MNGVPDYVKNVLAPLAFTYIIYLCLKHLYTIYTHKMSNTLLVFFQYQWSLLAVDSCFVMTYFLADASRNGLQVLFRRLINTSPHPTDPGLDLAMSKWAAFYVSACVSLQDQQKFLVFALDTFLLLHVMQNFKLQSKTGMCECTTDIYIQSKTGMCECTTDIYTVQDRYV